MKSIYSTKNEPHKLVHNVRCEERSNSADNVTYKVAKSILQYFVQEFFSQKETQKDFNNFWYKKQSLFKQQNLF